MKTKILSVLFFIFIFSSCSQKGNEARDAYIKALQYGEERIIIVSRNGDIRIYEIDGHEYITSYNGGIIHSETCKCKIQK